MFNEINPSEISLIEMHKFMNMKALRVAGSFAAAMLAVLLIPAACQSRQSPYEVPAAQDVVMYQINPRNFAQGPSEAGKPSVLEQIIPQLDSIRSLGANVVWVMPIYPIGQVKSKNSPYSIADYTAVNPEFGSLGDFKRLVRETHKRGMAFIMDWVANHTAWDHIWISRHPEWYTRDSTQAIIHPEGTDWTDVADLNYDEPGLRRAMTESMAFWIREADVDGFRCDVADQVPADFWKDCISALRTDAGRPILMLAEGNEPATLEAGFDMNYAWDYMNALRDVFCRDSSAVLLVRADSAEYARIPAGKVKLRFTTNHDEATKKSTVAEFGGQQGALAAYTATVFTHGAALVYGEQEVAYPEVINFFRYNPMDWSAHPETRAAYKRLLTVFREHPDLRNGAPVSYSTPDVLLLEKADKYLVVVNVRDSAQTVALPAAWRTLPRTSLLDGSQEAASESMALAPYAYRLFAR